MAEKNIKKEFAKLISDGNQILLVVQYKHGLLELDDEIKIFLEKTAKEIGDFKQAYHVWYAKGFRCVRLLAPERLDEFVGFYRGKKNAKDLNPLTAGITHFLQNLVSTKYGEKDNYLGTFSSGFGEQINILNSISENIDDALFNLQSDVQDQVFRSEIDVARGLLKSKNFRAAGAICGVVIESHLKAICELRKIKFRKKNLTISDYNEALKNEKAIDTVNWRYITRCGDIRNLCVHAKERDPTPDEIEDIIRGAEKVITEVE